MIFGRTKETKDPIIGVDVGTNTTVMAELSPDGTDNLLVRPGGEGLPVVSTLAAALGEESAVGHHTESLLEAGAPTIDVMGPFGHGRAAWEQNVVALDADPQDGLRRRYFAYLYDLAAESLDGWNGRIAVPARPARPDAGQDLLEEYLTDAGFEVVQRLESPLATAIGYWEFDSFRDQHFELDHWDGGVVLAVDMGVRYLDAAVISVQGHTYRPLAMRHGANPRTQIEGYAQYKAEQHDLDISPSAETAPQRFGLLDPLHQHFPELITGECESVTVTVPETFEAEDGTDVTLRAAEVQAVARQQMDSYGDVVDTVIAEAGLDSLADIDLVITGGLTSRWKPFLQWWIDQGATWGVLHDPTSTVDPDAAVRITGGVSGKLLAVQGASAKAHADVGHTKHDIDIAG